jgi:hypothetical protein
MKTLFHVILLLVSKCLIAQNFPDTLIKGNTFLRFNVANLADVSEPNISFGFDRRISNHVSLAMDAGYIIMSQRFNDLGRSSGFIIRPAVRYFPDKGKIFFEAELHYKQHTHHIHDWIGRDIAGGVAAYEEYKEFRLRKQVIGMHLKFGRLMPVTNRLWLEFYIGVGPHFRKFTIVEQKGLVYNFELLYENVTTGETERLVAIPMGCRILYRIR